MKSLENFSGFYYQSKENAVKISSDCIERFICKKNKISADILKRHNTVGSLLLNAAQFMYGNGDSDAYFLYL